MHACAVLLLIRPAPAGQNYKSLLATQTRRASQAPPVRGGARALQLRAWQHVPQQGPPTHNAKKVAMEDLDLQRQERPEKAAHVGAVAEVLQEERGKPPPWLAVPSTQRPTVPPDKEHGGHVRLYELDTWPSCSVNCHTHALQDAVSCGATWSGRRQQPTQQVHPPRSNRASAASAGGQAIEQVERTNVVRGRRPAPIAAAVFWCAVIAQGVMLEKRTHSRIHSYVSSDFPAARQDWNGLKQRPAYRSAVLAQRTPSLAPPPVPCTFRAVPGHRRAERPARERAR